MKMPSNKPSLAASKIAELLCLAKPGDLITYTELSALIGQDILRFRHYFYAAARIAEKEVGAVFVNRAGKGYRRVNGTELPAIGRAARTKGRSIHRHAYRSITAGAQRLNDIDPETRKRISAEQGMLNLLQQISKDRNLPLAPVGRSRTTSVAEASRIFLQLVTRNPPRHAEPTLIC